jgi:hypothetical protein
MNESWDKTYTNRWDDRYKDKEFVYGKDADIFLNHPYPNSKN